MIFKNISKLLLLIPFFILSCKSLDLISKKEEKIINYNDTIETSTIIQLNTYLTNDSVSKDSYDKLRIYKSLSIILLTSFFALATSNSVNFLSISCKIFE